MNKFLLKAFLGFLPLLCCASLRCIAADSPSASAKSYHPATNEFNALITAVSELLQSKDAGRFATNFSTSGEDWQSLLSKDSTPQQKDSAVAFAHSSDLLRQKVQASAEVLLKKAAAMHLNFSKDDWHPRVVPIDHIESIHIAALQATNESILWLGSLEIIYEPKTAAAGANDGELKLATYDMLKFPGGWRINQGMQWTSIPQHLIDDQTKREFAVMSKVEARAGLDGQDDPALLKLGETFIRFIRERDANIFEKEAYLKGESLYAHFQKTGHPGPAREQLIADVSKRGQEQTEIARAFLQQLTDTGADLKKADIQIKSLKIAHVQFQGVPGELAGLMGPEIKLTLTVKSDAKAKNGTSLSGDYVIALKQPMRLGDDWIVMAAPNWVQMPDGVLDREAMEKMNLDNYVAEHGTLPLGMAAPEIEFTLLNGEKKMKLSDLKGKVVVLDFWATWCVPCQAPLAELQKLVAAHADWKDKVAIVPLSIDDALDTARKHMDKRGWTNTFNVWAGEGGWRSTPIAAYHVSAVPTTYIIDAAGKIATAGNPAKLNLEKLVESMLKP